MWLYLTIVVAGAVLCSCPRPTRRYVYYKTKDIVTGLSRRYFEALEGEDKPRKRTIAPLNLKLD